MYQVYHCGHLLQICKDETKHYKWPIKQPSSKTHLGPLEITQGSIGSIQPTSLGDLLWKQNYDRFFTNLVYSSDPIGPKYIYRYPLKAHWGSLTSSQSTKLHGSLRDMLWT